jgi:DNA-directed RNA polymerase specialized sigma24 family protein
MEEPTKTEALLDEAVRLLAILAKRGVSQATIITELNNAGFQPKRIADLLGTTPNTVSVTLHAARKRKRGAS